MNAAKRRKLSIRITISALALLLLSAGVFLWVAVTDHDGTALIPVILIGAVMFFAWRAPGKAGILLLLFSPIGFFLALLVSTNLEGLVWLGGIPLISGVLLVLADVLLPVARDEETSAI